MKDHWKNSLFQLRGFVEEEVKKRSEEETADVLESLDDRDETMVETMEVDERNKRDHFH